VAAVGGIILAMAGWQLTLRVGPKIEHLRFEGLPEAVGALEQRMDELAPEARRQTAQVFKREFDPVRQVVARGEVVGPGGLFGAARGGIDLRGDGSAEAYTGRVRRSLVGLQPGETAYDGLRRALKGRDGGGVEV
jgi:hypothetical protein